MPDPYKVLNVTPEDDDETVRQAYLAAARQFPPDRCPEEFARVSAAYEKIKTEDRRLALFLFDPARGETLDELLTEERCRTSMKRVGLSSLLSLLNEG